ncbi:MAG: EI24 domain-containing protein [Sphingomonadales bacterium]|nr:EI24 domain-containing protein [Sphingomonadales bacterium]
MLQAFALALGQLTDRAVLRVWLKSMTVALLVFVALGAVCWWGIRATLAYYVNDYSSGFDELAAAIIVVALCIVLWRIVALAVLQLYADEVVAAVEARYYPAAAASARKLGWHEELGASLRSAGRAVGFNLLALPFALVLLVTGLGPALVFTLVNAVLLGRELQDMVWIRHRPNPRAPAPLSSIERISLGLVVALLLLVPFANFAAPFLGAAAAAHLIHRKERIAHVA